MTRSKEVQGTSTSMMVVTIVTIHNILRGEMDGWQHRFMTTWSLMLLLRNIGVFAVDCRRNEIKVQKERTPPESNGCSKPEFIKVGGEEDFTFCCDRHDTCYGMCGEDKAFCDKDFETCLKKLCKSNFAHNKECLAAASMYTMGTMMFGVEGFSGSQEQHCTCIPKDDPSPSSTVTTGEESTAEPVVPVQLTAVEAHYVKLVDDFYATHVSTGSPPTLTTEELVLSYSRTKKLPLYRLYYDLHKKFDNAIKHIDGRVNRNPPRPPEKKKVPKVAIESVDPTIVAGDKKEL